MHHAIAPGVYPKLAYDIEKDFQPIAVVAVVPQVIVVNPDRVKATTLGELSRREGEPGLPDLRLGRQRHLAPSRRRAVQGRHRDRDPARALQGCRTALQDLIGGQIDMMFDGLGSSAGHIKSGRIRPLAVASKERSPILPDVPTAAEAGLSGYEVHTWYALWALEGTPQDIVDRLVVEVDRALDSEQVKTVWASQGASPGPLTPDEMASFVSAEIARWGKVADDADIKIE